jgi:hypothetical protein
VGRLAGYRFPSDAGAATRYEVMKTDGARLAPRVQPRPVSRDTGSTPMIFSGAIFMPRGRKAAGAAPTRIMAHASAFQPLSPPSPRHHPSLTTPLSHSHSLSVASLFLFGCVGVALSGTYGGCDVVRRHLFCLWSRFTLRLLLFVLVGEGDHLIGSILSLEFGKGETRARGIRSIDYCNFLDISRAYSIAVLVT